MIITTIIIIIINLCRGVGAAVTVYNYTVEIPNLNTRRNTDYLDGGLS
jgi:hypothetical protein